VNFSTFQIYKYSFRKQLSSTQAEISAKIIDMTKKRKEFEMEKQDVWETIESLIEQICRDFDKAEVCGTEKKTKPVK